MKNNNTTHELLKVIISLIVLLLFTYLVIVDRTISEDLLNLVFIIIGYWFAGKEFYRAITNISEKIKNGDK
jgi:hypothetical protein